MLSPLLLEEELHIIFGRVSNLFSKSLADAYARLEPLVSKETFCPSFLALTAFMLGIVLRAQACKPQNGLHLVMTSLWMAVSSVMGEQGPAWEAQCHADTHMMLSTLQALPLDPETASGTMDHLTQLCTLRFADPSPSGYTIPGQLPSPVSYSSASQASTPGTTSSLATAPGAPSPAAGRQLEQVGQSCHAWTLGPFQRHASTVQTFHWMCDCCMMHI